MQTNVNDHYIQITNVESFYQCINNNNINEKSFIIFLNELFHDLLRRSSTTPKDTSISKLTFIESLGLPLIISERLFHAFTNNKLSQQITRDEFIKGFIDLYGNDIQPKLKLVSKMFDFNLNGMLNIDDIILLFIHFDYFSIERSVTFTTIKEIENLIYKSLTPKKKITVCSFENIINNYNGDTFYLFLLYLNHFCPFKKEQIEYFVERKECIRSSNTFHHSSQEAFFVLTPQNKRNNEQDKQSKMKLGVDPSDDLINLLINYKQEIRLSEDNDNNNTLNNKTVIKSNSKSIINEDDEISDLNDLELFEEDLLSTLSKIEYCFVPKCNTNVLYKQQIQQKKQIQPVIKYSFTNKIRKQKTFTAPSKAPLESIQKTSFGNNNNNDDNIISKKNSNTNLNTFNSILVNNSARTSILTVNNSPNFQNINTNSTNSNIQNKQFYSHLSPNPKKRHYLHSKTIDINKPKTPQHNKPSVSNFTSSLMNATSSSSSTLAKRKRSSKRNIKISSGCLSLKEKYNIDKEDYNIEYHNINNYFNIHVNYYTRSGAVRDCILLLINDIIFVHIFNGFCYKYLKMINLKFTLIEEIENWETLSNSVLSRIKLNSFLNKNLKEMVFSSPNKDEMDSFISIVKRVSKHQSNINEKYRNIKEIYRGAKSKLYLGENIFSKEQVAIKYINLSSCTKQENYETMLWEFELMKLLQKTTHKNIVKVYDLYKTTEYFIFVLEYIPHGNLKSYLIENRYSLSPSNLKTIVQQLSNAVLFLHSNGIIHRDLKPENILVKIKDKNKIKIKLIDLGFGKIIGKGCCVTESYGTFGYASPEVLLKIPYTFETDIWSLGVILYLIMVGTHPFGENDKDLKTIHTYICEGIYSFPDDSNIKINIKDIIELCLKVEPKQRPKIHDIVKMLKKI